MFLNLYQTACQPIKEPLYLLSPCMISCLNLVKTSLAFGSYMTKTKKDTVYAE
jgi:hypothetical protein